MGPCRPDGHNGLVCGTGDGAARVIDGTVSPSRRFALAWRSTGSLPTEMPSGDLEDLVIRIRDGAILATEEGEYWHTPEGGHANRVDEFAIWSPDSRLMIKTFNTRFDTSTVDLYAFDANDKLGGPFNLRKTMEEALHAALKRQRKDPDAYSFWTSGGKSFKIDNRGLVHARVMMWVPKDGPTSYYDMTLQVAHKGRTFDAKVLSVRPSRKKL
jgi:hypothetical protein